jgi:hypothetical protein
MIITLTHAEATQLHQELSKALADRNLDTLQVVTIGSDIRVVKAGETPKVDIYNLNDAD